MRFTRYCQDEKSRRTRTAGHVVRMVKNVMKDRQIIWWESLAERNRLKHQCTDGTVTLKQRVKDIGGGNGVLTSPVEQG